MSDLLPKGTARRAFGPKLVAALGLLIMSALACGEGGLSVPACQAGTPSPQPITPTPTESLTLSVGSYVGTGSPQCISGLGLDPALVIIKGEGSSFAVWRSTAMEGDATADFASGQPDFEDGIESLDRDGFSLGKHVSANEEAVTYHYIAFAASPDIAVGSYVGDGRSGLSVTGVGFEPVLVFLKWNGLRSAVWRSTAQPEGVSSFFDSRGDEKGFITAFGPDGFQVGGDPWVNHFDPTSGDQIYHYVAFRDAPGTLASGSYVGDGSADRSIGDVGFQPDYVWIKRDSPESKGVHRTSVITGDVTLRFANEPIGTDEIKALTPEGFSVGAALSVNAEDETYHYVAWKAAAAP